MEGENRKCASLEVLHKEGCWLLSGAGKVMGRAILISSPLLPAAPVLPQSCKRHGRHCQCRHHLVQELQYGFVLSKNSEAISSKILCATDFPHFGVCEDAKMGLFPKFCHIPSTSSFWCCLRDSHVPVTGSVWV